jgi:hypothetical protein
MGAVALAGVARAAWMFNLDPEDEDRETYLMVRGKLNVGKKTEGLRYSIRAKEIPRCGSQPYIEWGGATSISAGKALGLFDPFDGNGKGKKSRNAEEWLSGYLAGGPKPTEKIKAAAAAAGIKERTLENAKAKLSAPAEKLGEKWFWGLPGAFEDRKVDEAL